MQFTYIERGVPAEAASLVVLDMKLSAWNPKTRQFTPDHPPECRFPLARNPKVPGLVAATVTDIPDGPVFGLVLDGAGKPMRPLVPDPQASTGEPIVVLFKPS